MGESWASLYLVACSVLGDESEAGDWVVQARTEAELSRRIAARAPLPAVLPAASPEVADHVTLLRRRSTRRRQAMRVWGVAAAVLVIGLAALVWPAVRAFSDADTARYDRPAVAAAESGGWTFQIHEAAAGPGGLTVWWSLTGPGAASLAGRPVLEAEANLPRIGGEPATAVRTSGRGLLMGQTWLPVTVPPAETVPLTLRLGGEHWVVDVPVDRTDLIALERRVAVNEVVSRRGAGVFIKSITMGPAYTVVDWEPWMAPEAIHKFDTRLALSLRTDVGSVQSLSTGGPRSAHFAALPEGASSLVIASNELIWATAVRLPLQSGESDQETGLTLGLVSREQDRLAVQAEVGRGYVPVETVAEDTAGRAYRPVSLQIGQGTNGQAGKWGLQAIFLLPADVKLAEIQVRVVQHLPPLELVLRP